MRIAATLDRKLRAFDVETGRELWSGDLPAGGKATPMTYLGADGPQYIVTLREATAIGSGAATPWWRSRCRKAWHRY